MTLGNRNRIFDAALFASLFFFLFLALFVSACSSRIPARIETIDGRQIEIATAGTGGPATVVFEAGLGRDWTDWDEVASKMSLHTQVFAYSRPGYGASGPATTPRDPKTIVEELRRLLAALGYVPPYVLAGHSNGGAYMELFAKSHPDEVAGVVLVEPRHRDFLATCEAAMLDLCGIPESTLAAQAPVVIAEYRAYAMASEEIRVAGGFGAYPVRVLTAADIAGSAQRQALWSALHASLAAEAADGRRTVVEGAGHGIQIDQPGEVAKAVLDVLPQSSP